MADVPTLAGNVLQELGACAAGANIVLGDRLGFYKALAKLSNASEDVGSGRCTAADLANETHTQERYCREWLSGQSASGWVSYDKETDTFYLTAAQQAVFADGDSLANMVGGFEIVEGLYKNLDALEDKYRRGGGVGYDHQLHCTHEGIERFLAPIYRGNLMANWIPAFPGLAEKLEKGAKVADIGCGCGAATLIMAKAYPNSKFYGYDYAEEVIEKAKKNAESAGVTNVHFETCDARTVAEGGFDLVAFFDCLHDMPDPVGAIRQVANVLLGSDGVCMVVEPYAGDSLSDNLNPLGRCFYNFSSMLCLPGALSSAPARGLGAQAGFAALSQVIQEGGLTTVDAVVKGPMNLVLKCCK